MTRILRPAGPRLGVTVAIVLGLVVTTPALAHPGPARTATPPPATATGCEEHEAWVAGNTATVAAALPAGYTAVTDSNGAPIVFARAEHCGSFTVGGRTQPLTLADWGVVVNSPDGQGCGSGIPTVGAIKGDVPPVCNWYPLALVTNDRALVDWLRQATPTVPASYRTDLTYKDGTPDASGDMPFHFSGDGFAIDDVSSFRPGTISLRGGYWAGTPQGTVKLIVSTDDLIAGPASTTVRALHGSALARLMGAVSRSSVEPYAEFGIIRLGHGVLRKQLFGPQLPGEAALHEYAGSCSFAGNVTFDPPATNTQAWTTYTYDATGTCTGTLDGHAVSNVPAHMYHAGRSYASCLQGLAFPPGVGAVTINGTRIADNLDFTTDATEVNGTIYGTRSGQATGHATFLTQRTSPTITVDCGSSDVKHAPMNLSFSTQRDLVSSG